jgi:hypothetical protein
MVKIAERARLRRAKKKKKVGKGEGGSARFARSAGFTYDTLPLVTPRVYEYIEIDFKDLDSDQ